MIINLSGLGLGSLTRRKAANLEETLEQVAAPLSNLLLLYRARKKRSELIAELEAANEQDMLEVEYCRQQLAFLHQKEEENHKRALAIVNTGGISGPGQGGRAGHVRGASGTNPAPADELASQYYWEENDLESAVQLQEQVVADVSSLPTPPSVSNLRSNSSSSEETAATKWFTPANSPDNYEDDVAEEADDNAEEAETEAVEYAYEDVEEDDEDDEDDAGANDYFLPSQAEYELDLGVTDFSEIGSKSENEEELARTSTSEQLVTSTHSASVTASSSSSSSSSSGVPIYVAIPVATSPAEQELDELMAELNNLAS